MIEPAVRIPPADENKAVTDEYIKAVNLNRRIITAAQLAQQSLYEMCMGFKEMRDSKLYKELGYSDFGDYCENETGMKRRQVYNYIAVAEKLPTEFVHSGAQIGVKKLYLLTTLSEEERAEITSSTDLESSTVRDLEQQIKQLRAERDRATAEKSAAEAENAARGDAVSALEKTRRELENRITTLEKDIRELKNRPIETAVEYVDRIPEDYIAKEAYERTVRDYTAQLEQADNDFLEEKRRAHSEKTELEKQLADVKQQLEAAKSAPAAPDTEGVFKAHFTNAYNALNTLAEYVQEHSEFAPNVGALMDNFTKSLEAIS